MNLIYFDNVLSDPKSYVDQIYSNDFIDFVDGNDVFKNVQSRSNDEFAEFVMACFPYYKISWNFVRMSPFQQKEPNFIHTDDMMGDITCILYLSEKYPKEDGTTIYDDSNEPVCTVYSKFNRMVAFDSGVRHSRNIFDNFGTGRDSRLVQVIFLKQM